MQSYHNSTNCCKGDRLQNINTPQGLAVKNYRQQYLCELCQVAYDQIENPTIIILRKKLHESQSENFGLKLQLSKQRKQITELEQKNSSLQANFKQHFQQLKNYDTEIQKYAFQLKQSTQYVRFLQEKLEVQKSNSQKAKLKLHEQQQFIFSLNQQNELMIRIKKGLSDQNMSLRSSHEHINSKYFMKEKQIQKLKVEINYLIKDVQNLEELVYNKNQEILNYEVFLNHKDRQIKQQKREQIDDQVLQQQVWKKLEKYKKKALKYRQQRNQLFQQIQQAKKEIGTITLRKYFTPDQTVDG